MSRTGWPGVGFTSAGTNKVKQNRRRQLRAQNEQYLSAKRRKGLRKAKAKVGKA